MSGVISPSLGLSPARPFPDDCLARFKPVRELASGGYGAVYLARQESLDRLVAVKLLLGHILRDAAQIQRFVAEARITASIQHAHVVTVIDHGAEYRVPWIAYEYLPGASLRDTLSNGPLTPLEAARAAQHVAEALDAAHAVNVLHRDIKPDNVLAAAAGHYKVADFGIARWVDQAGVKTGTGLILGTPAYIAPEQVKGLPASAASDIYALGVTLFELVTGEQPFQADNPLKLLEMQIHAPVPVPSERNRRVPPELDRIVMKAMAKEPGERWASARQLAEALAAFQAMPQRPVSLSSGRIKRTNTGRSSTARITLASRGVPVGLASVSAGPASAPRIAWSHVAIAGLVLGAVMLVAALVHRPGPPAGMPTPAPPLVVASPSVPSGAATAPSLVAPPEWLAPLEARLRTTPTEPDEQATPTRIRAALDGLWRRVDPRSAEPVPEMVLLNSLLDLQRWHPDLKRQRAALFAARDREHQRLKAMLLADFDRARARGVQIAEAGFRYRTLPFHLAARIALYVSLFAEKRYEDFRPDAVAWVDAQIAVWSRQHPERFELALMRAAVLNLKQDTSLKLWAPLLEQAERAAFAESKPSLETVRAWYLFLRHVISFGGSRDADLLAHVMALEERLLPRTSAWVTKARYIRDQFIDQFMLAKTGISGLEF